MHIGDSGIQLENHFGDSGIQLEIHIGDSGIQLENHIGDSGIRVNFFAFHFFIPKGTMGNWTHGNARKVSALHHWKLDRKTTVDKKWILRINS